MNRLAILIAIPLMLVTLAGCTTRAQVVKDIYLDGKGGLVVSYVTLRHSDFLIHPAGKLSEGTITTKTFYLGQYHENTTPTNSEKK